MKVQVIRLKLNHDTGVATPEGGILYDLENEKQKENYLKDMCKLQEGYAYNISVYNDETR